MRVLQGLLIGCAIGALFGVLFAPQRGEETRAELQKWVQERQEQAMKRGAQLREHVTTVLEQGRQRANIPLEVVRRATGQVVGTAQEQFDRFQ